MQKPTLDISIVIPVYNEAESLPGLHAELVRRTGVTACPKSTADLDAARVGVCNASVCCRGG
jgi:hypothetical protein